MIVRATVEAETRRIRTARSLNYELAALIRVGFHDPKKFPSFDKFVGKEKRRAEPGDLRDYLMHLSQASKKPTTAKG